MEDLGTSGLSSPRILPPRTGTSQRGLRISGLSIPRITKTVPPELELFTEDLETSGLNLPRIPPPPPILNWNWSTLCRGRMCGDYWQYCSISRASRYLFFLFLIESIQFFGYIELSNAGMHFVGDVATAHSGEKYMYAGKHSISSPGFLKMLKHYPFFRSSVVKVASKSIKNSSRY